MFGFPEITSNISINCTHLKIPANILVKLANLTFYEPVKVDILIGTDLFWDLLRIVRISLGAGKQILQNICTKAVHIELVSSICTDCFIWTIRRFILRRGLLAHIFRHFLAKFFFKWLHCLALYNSVFSLLWRRLESRHKISARSLKESVAGRPPYIRGIFQFHHLNIPFSGKVAYCFVRSRLKRWLCFEA